MRELINPYHPDTIPESRRGFFGREDLVVWLEQQLIAQRRVFIFHGPHLIGKTAFLHFLPEMITLRSTVLNFSFSQIVDISLNALSIYLLQSLTEQVIRQELLAADQITTTTDFVAGVDAILTELTRQAPEREVLFLIDDFDRVLDLPADKRTDLLDRCEALLNSHNTLRFVVAINSVTLPHLQHTMLDAAPVKQISTLASDSAQHLIIQPVEGVLRFDYGVIKRIAEINSNHPYYLTLFNQFLFNRHARAGWINLRHLDETIDAVLALEIPAFTAIWQRASWIERAVLMTMASIQGSHGILTRQEIVTPFVRTVKDVDETILLTAVESLTFQGVLVQMGALNYRFHVDLFRFWLQKQFDLDSILAEVIWKQPTARPVAIEPPTDNQVDETAIQRKETQRQWPIWILGFMGVTVLVIVGALILLLNEILRPAPTSSSLSFNETAASPNGNVAVIPTFTATPAPTLTPTPTPPQVVPRSLPSIAYMARQGDTPWQIQVMDLNRTAVFAISDLLANDTTPVWSYQGNKLAFVSQRNNNREIYLMDVDGGNLVNFTNNPAEDWTPAWSPDGQQIAYASNRFGNWEIFVANVDGSNLRQLTNTGSGNISPTWSPDGQVLTFSTKRDNNWEIYTMRTDGTELRRLTYNEVNDLAPVWSASGDYIAYETNLDGNVEIYVMTSVGGNPRNVSNASYADDHGPVWSPDDESLVFYSNREGNWDLFAVDINNGHTINLTNTPNIDEQTPAWRP